MNAVVRNMSQWYWGLWRNQGENRKFIHHQGPPGGERTYLSRSNYNQILMSCLFCRKPSSSIPKMPPPFIFWATGESIYCSILVNKVENRIKKKKTFWKKYYPIYSILLHNIYCLKCYICLRYLLWNPPPQPPFSFEKQGAFIIFPTACQ